MIKVNVTKFRSSYADANPEWLVIEKRGRGTWIAEVIDCPDYAGAKQAFTTEQIEGSRGMSRMFAKLVSDSDKFLDNLATGSFVHYRNSGNYVRCQVTADKQLLPVALVGDWRPYDLPRRAANGEIYYGYHVDSIRNKKTFRPNANHLYEYQKMPYDKVNPATLPTINWTVPEMTPDEAAEAEKHRILEQIVTIANNNKATARGRLDTIRNILDPNAL
jgi:hypothetical protein